MKKLFQKTKQAAQKLVVSVYQKELLAAKAVAAKEALITATEKRTLADALGSITAAFNSLLASCYQTLFGFSTFTLSQVQAQIEDLKDTRDEYQRQRAIHAANLDGYPLLTGVLLRLLLFVLAAAFISIADMVILSNTLQLLTTNLLSAILLAEGICIALVLLPAFSCILAQRASSVRMRTFIEWGSFAFASLVFVLLIYARSSYDEAIGQQQSGLAYLFYYGLNLLSYLVLHLLAKLLLVPVLRDIKEAWARQLEKRKVKKLTSTINHINKQIAAKQEEADLLQNAEAEAVLMEEMIARYYSQVISTFREAYRLNARNSLPNWLSDAEPTLNFIVKGNQPLTAISLSQDRFSNTRTPIGFTNRMLLIACLPLWYSCSLSEPKPTQFTGVLFDQTSNDSLQLTSKEVVKLSGLTNDIDRGVEFCLVTVSAKQFSPVYRYSLQSVSLITSNTAKRPGAVALFERGIDSLMDVIPPVSKALKDSSRIFYKLSQAVQEFVACSVCSEGVIVVQSDLMEHTGLFSVYSDTDILLQHPDQVADVLRTAYPLPEFTKPLKVLVVHNPPLSQETVFACMLEILKTYFARSNVTVEMAL